MSSSNTITLSLYFKVSVTPSITDLERPKLTRRSNNLTDLNPFMHVVDTYALVLHHPCHAHRANGHCKLLGRNVWPPDFEQVLERSCVIDLLIYKEHYWCVLF